MLEPWFSHLISEQQSNEFIVSMANWDLKWAFQIIQWIEQKERTKTKWRSPFFICRPAYTEKIIELPINISSNIEKKINSIMELILLCSDYIKYIFEKWEEISKEKILEYLLKPKNKDYYIWSNLEDSIAYFQADTFINLRWEIIVENIQMPDVWFFLKHLSSKWSLQDIKKINEKLRKKIVDKILQFWFNKITLITRNEVLDNNEDLLEINEIEVLKTDFEQHGINVSVSSIDDLNFDENILYLLMNLDYSVINEQIIKLFNLAVKNTKNFSPNPFLQFVSKHITWFNTIRLIEEEKIKEFWIITNPNHNKINEETFLRIENYFNRLWLDPKKRILNIKKLTTDEVLYVSRDSLHSLRKIPNFINWEKYIEIIEVPFIDWEQILLKRWHDLLNMFRFMFLK